MKSLLDMTFAMTLFFIQLHMLMLICDNSTKISVITNQKNIIYIYMYYIVTIYKQQFNPLFFFSIFRLLQPQHRDATRCDRKLQKVPAH